MGASPLLHFIMGIIVILIPLFVGPLPTFEDKNAAKQLLTFCGDNIFEVSTESFQKPTYQPIFEIFINFLHASSKSINAQFVYNNKLSHATLSLISRWSFHPLII